MVFKTHLFYTLSTISLLLSGLAELIFFQTVLLEVSYNCYLEDPAQKCFEFFLNDLSAPETVGWVNWLRQSCTWKGACDMLYRLGLNLSSAVAASLGTFKLFSVVLTLMSWRLIILRRWGGKCVEILQYLTILILKRGILYFAIIICIGTLRLMVLQIVVMVEMFIAFVSLPWGQLIALKKLDQSRRLPSFLKSRNR